MDIYNFLGVIYATDRSKSSRGMGFYQHDTTDSTPKEVVAAGWVEAMEEDRPAGPILRWHTWPSRTPSPTTNSQLSLQNLRNL